jgi:hypothetical protein
MTGKELKYRAESFRRPGRFLTMGFQLTLGELAIQIGISKGELPIISSYRNPRHNN